MKWLLLFFFAAAAVSSLSAQPSWTSFTSGEWSNPAIGFTSGGATAAPIPGLNINMKVIIAEHAVTQCSNPI